MNAASRCTNGDAINGPADPKRQKVPPFLEGARKALVESFAGGAEFAGMCAATRAVSPTFSHGERI